jgi:hypothetical protein
MADQRVDNVVLAGPAYVLRQPICAEFVPKEDITAYELAQLLPYFQGRALWPEDLTALGDVARHLKVSNG